MPSHLYGTHSTSAIDYSKVNVEGEVARLKKLALSRDGAQPEFLQAFEEVIDSVIPVLQAQPKYLAVLEALMEPERVIQFRVPWFDEKGNLQINRGFRVQYSSALGPYKGGLRLHPTVSLSVLKFLGFEQVFKNSLTGLPMGGGKGGSDFDPKGRSDLEIRSFCQSFMSELCKHIGPDTDVPAGDIGVGGREIGFLFGEYRKIRNEFTGVLTGKGVSWGGSLCRPEATGYGAVYFAKHMLEDRKETLEGKRCLVSGSGNAAQYTAEKLLQFKARVLTLSDSNGYIYAKDGLTQEHLAQVMQLKNVKRGRLAELGENMAGVVYVAGKKPWSDVPADIAFPAATQNEIFACDARTMADNGVSMVVEVANMPSDQMAIKVYKDRHMAYAPGKASNAGGVAVSGMEMAQNSSRTAWSFEKTDEELQKVMAHIYKSCKDAATKYGCPGDLQAGANMAGFVKVADAMLDQGLF
eukprot:Gregarina_sp_Pseudo_9__571@NODE_1368_length_1659_cov_448_806790_g1277_i0_p1_GENE_NODE_1368_length_1659_cov_448_806790_g1277_i0NODE_1368_length_1659_cov_448_806790_g1277_i0_p1_ORF_typecomplete_len491_score147_53ELFV_dehydrog/PF00208_21/4_4e56ELFV_dehydrog_N/PF02812_18/1_2e40ELFV_dehydrog_N/PF02812_18/1_5e04NAD_binding_7/PF13241_6/0_00048Pyr_redox_3/PF13738_6/0_0442Hacid_dh_C/PF02826_19/0_049AdoHcyase_NAD/PF00670_21/0_22Shikimate_DH/PF01488_20/0_26_NODE_1368_length_1659_cov_448_806790_g1277_i07414